MKAEQFMQICSTDAKVTGLCICVYFCTKSPKIDCYVQWKREVIFVNFKWGLIQLLHHRVQPGPEAHTASYPVGTRGSFLGLKGLGREADHSPTSTVEVKECVELYFRSPNTPSWRGAQLKKQRDNVTFTLFS
jgi:hypothetical protein